MSWRTAPREQPRPPVLSMRRWSGSFSQPPRFRRASRPSSIRPVGTAGCGLASEPGPLTCSPWRCHRVSGARFATLDRPGCAGGRGGRLARRCRQKSRPVSVTDVPVVAMRHGSQKSDGGAFLESSIEGGPGSSPVRRFHPLLRVPGGHSCRPPAAGRTATCFDQIVVEPRSLRLSPRGRRCDSSASPLISVEVHRPEVTSERDADTPGCRNNGIVPDRGPREKPAHGLGHGCEGLILRELA